MTENCYKMMKLLGDISARAAYAAPVSVSLEMGVLYFGISRPQGGAFYIWGGFVLFGV